MGWREQKGLIRVDRERVNIERQGRRERIEKRKG
jgi:hypothetical protein